MAHKQAREHRAFDEQYERALRAAAAADRAEPRAAAAFYERKSGRVVVELTNGASFAFPPELAEGLAGASAEDLAQVEVTPSGSGLHWETLEADLSVPGLLAGIFGTRAWMAELGRRGGQASTAAKADAARENGRKGGRPRKAVG